MMLRTAKESPWYHFRFSKSMPRLAIGAFLYLGLAKSTTCHFCAGEPPTHLPIGSDAHAQRVGRSSGYESLIGKESGGPGQT
jgi:hypothetical protein